MPDPFNDDNQSRLRDSGGSSYGQSRSSDRSRLRLSEGAYGYNDTRRSVPMPDWESIRYNRTMNQAGNALARGLITSDEYNSVMSQDNKNWIQTFLFDVPRHVAGVVGFDVYNEPGSPGYDPNKWRGGLTAPDTPATGGFLETLGDTLGIGSIVMASMAEARQKAVTYDERGLGHFVSNFADAWGNRTSFIKFSEDHDVFGSSRGNFWGGLAADILLDPLSYLTLGVAAGAKIAAAPLKGVAKSGSKVATTSAETLTLSRFGREMYRMSAESLNSQFIKEMGSEAREGVLRNRHLLDADTATKWNQRIVEHMVDPENFNYFQHELLRRKSEGRWRRLMHLAPASEVNRSALASGVRNVSAAVNPHLGKYKGLLPEQAGLRTTDDLFDETASFATRDRGIRTNIRSRLAKSKIGGETFTKVFQTFDRDFNAPADVVQALKETENNIDQQVSAATARFADNLRNLSGEDRALVSRLVEEGYDWSERGSGTLAGAVEYSDEIRNAVNFVRNEMEDILKTEQAAGFEIGNVANYITHVYALKPQQKIMAAQAIFDNGEESVNAVNKYRQQRLIATIADAEELYGEGSVMTDALEILRIRKRASVQMIERTKLNKLMIRRYGIPALLIDTQRQGTSGSLVRGLLRRSTQGVAKVLNFGQVYRSENGNLKRLGFKEGDDAHNLSILRYLMRAPDDVADDATRAAGRLSEKGKAHLDRIDVPDEIKERLQTQVWERKGSAVKVGTANLGTVIGESIPQTFRWKTTRLKSMGIWTAKKVHKAWASAVDEFKVEDAMLMMMDDKHPGWDMIFDAMVDGKKASSFRMAPLLGFLGGFHAFTVKHLDAQLAGFMPDLERRVHAALEQRLVNRAAELDPGAARGKSARDLAISKHRVKISNTFRKNLAKAMSELTEDIKLVKHAPQISQTIVDLAKVSRRAAGILTDYAKPSQRQSDEILKLGVKLGFDSDTFKQLYRSMFDKDVIETAAEADVVLDMFRNLTDDTFAARMLGLSKGSKKPIRNGPWTDELVSVKFTLPLQKTDNIFSEALDEIQRNVDPSLDTTRPLSETLVPGSMELDDVTDVATNIIPDAPKPRVQRALNKATAIRDSAHARLSRAENEKALIGEKLKALPKDLVKAHSERKTINRVIRNIKLASGRQRLKKTRDGVTTDRAFWELSDEEKLPIVRDLMHDLVDMFKMTGKDHASAVSMATEVIDDLIPPAKPPRGGGAGGAGGMGGDIPPVLRKYAETPFVSLGAKSRSAADVTADTAGVKFFDDAVGVEPARAATETRTVEGLIPKYDERATKLLESAGGEILEEVLDVVIRNPPDTRHFDYPYSPSLGEPRAQAQSRHVENILTSIRTTVLRSVDRAEYDRAVQSVYDTLDFDSMIMPETLLSTEMLGFPSETEILMLAVSSAVSDIDTSIIKKAIREPDESARDALIQGFSGQTDFQTLLSRIASAARTGGQEDLAGGRYTSGVKDTADTAKDLADFAIAMTASYIKRLSEALSTEGPGSDDVLDALSIQINSWDKFSAGAQARNLSYQGVYTPEQIDEMTDFGLDNLGPVEIASSLSTEAGARGDAVVALMKFFEGLRSRRVSVPDDIEDLAAPFGQGEVTYESPVSEIKSVEASTELGRVDPSKIEYLDVVSERILDPESQEQVMEFLRSMGLEKDLNNVVHYALKSLADEHLELQREPIRLAEEYRAILDSDEAQELIESKVLYRYPGEAWLETNKAFDPENRVSALLGNASIYDSGVDEYIENRLVGATDLYGNPLVLTEDEKLYLRALKLKRKLAQSEPSNAGFWDDAKGDVDWNAKEDWNSRVEANTDRQSDAIYGLLSLAFTGSVDGADKARLLRELELFSGRIMNTYFRTDIAHKDLPRSVVDTWQIHSRNVRDALKKLASENVPNPSDEEAVRALYDKWASQLKLVGGKPKFDYIETDPIGTASSSSRSVAKRVSDQFDSRSKKVMMTVKVPKESPPTVLDRQGSPPFEPVGSRVEGRRSSRAAMDPSDRRNWAWNRLDVPVEMPVRSGPMQPPVKAKSPKIKPFRIKRNVAMAALKVANKAKKAAKKTWDEKYKMPWAERTDLKKQQGKARREVASARKAASRAESKLRKAQERAGVNLSERTASARRKMLDAMDAPLPSREAEEQARLASDAGATTEELLQQFNPQYSGAIQDTQRSMNERVYFDLKNRLMTEANMDEPNVELVESLKKQVLEARDVLGYKPGRNSPAAELAGRTDTLAKNQDIEVYLPKEIARVIKEYQSPVYNPAFPKAINEILRKYDAVQTYFKSNLLLAWSGTWSRNAFSAALMSYTSNGINLMDPTNNFEKLGQWVSIMRYAMWKHTDLPKARGIAQDKIDEFLEKTGKIEIESRMTGRKITIEEMVEEAMIRGVFKSMHSAEAMDVMARGQGIGGAATIGALAGGYVGGMPGAAVGALAGGAAGAKIANRPGLEQRVGGSVSGAAAGASMGALAGAAIDQDQSADGYYLSALGAATGAALGARRPKVVGDTVMQKAAAKDYAGIPVAGLDRVTGLLQSQWMPLLRVGETVTETPFRLANFLGGFHETGSMGEATNRVVNTLNDWNNLSVFERRVMRRIVPFYTWTKHALAWTYREAINNPGRLSQPHKFVNAWMTSEGYDPEDVPEFFHEKLGVLSRVGEGQVEFVYGAGAPQEDVAGLVNALLPNRKTAAEDRREFLSGALGRGPFGVMSMLEGAFNTDTFTGREIQSEAELSYFARGSRWDTAPGWLQHVVGYRPATENSRAVVDPSMAWLLGEIPVSRFVDLMKKIHSMDAEEKRSLNTRSLALSFLGVGAYRYDPETQKTFVNRAKVDRMNALLVAAGAVDGYTNFNSVEPKKRNQTRGRRTARTRRSTHRSR